MIDIFIGLLFIAIIAVVAINLIFFNKEGKIPIDTKVIKASRVSKSVILSYILLFILLFLVYFLTDYSQWLILIVLTIGLLATLYGMSMKKRWSIIIWAATCGLSLIFYFLDIDKGKMSGFALIILVMMIIILDEFNKEKSEWYFKNYRKI